MNCHFCSKKIEGKSFDRNIGVCHPAVSYDAVKICKNCHLFPSNNIESKETLIK